MTSGLQDITYQQLVDVVKNYIKTNCTNITNYAGIPAVFKAGYSNQYTIPGGNAAATCYCTTTITGGDIVQATASDVDTDMNNFIETIYSKQYLSQYIKDSELIKFVNDLVIFCSTRLLYSTSVLNSSKYLIYSKSQSTSDFSWHYENDSLTSKYLYKHLKEDCEYYKEIYYKCTSKETGDIIYTTKTNFVPDNFDQTTYDYIMDYIDQYGKLPSGETEISDQNISDEYVSMSGRSPLVYDISEYTYTYNSVSGEFTPLSDTDASAYIGYIEYDEEHFLIDENDYIVIEGLDKPEVSQTIGSYVITYILADDGHEICLPNMEQTILDIYNAYGICTFYILDINNKRFKYPIGVDPDSYENAELINLNGTTYKEIDFTDASTIINAVVNITKKNIREVPVQYNVNYT